MSEQTLSREERIQKIIDEAGAELNLADLREDAKNPKRFFVGEYEMTEELVGLTTVDTLEEAEQHINDCGDYHEFDVIDLDTSRLHHVFFTANVER